MLDFVLENVQVEYILTAVVGLVVLALIKSWTGGAANAQRRDLHQRTVILAVSRYVESESHSNSSGPTLVGAYVHAARAR